MLTPIPYQFQCLHCQRYTISGELEDEEEFESGIYCPGCGRLNSIPTEFWPREDTSTTATAEKNTPSKVSPTRIAWRFRSETVSRIAGALRNCPAIDGQGRVVAAVGTELVALSPCEAGCEIAWKFVAGDVIPGSPVVGPNGVIYAHSGDGLLHAVDSNGRAIRPPTKVGPALGWSTPLVDEENRVWICASIGGLIRVMPDGQTTSRPFLRSPSRFDCTGLINQGVMYVGSEDHFLHAIDLTGDKGRELWNQKDQIGLTGWYINSAIALFDQSLLITVSRDDHIYAFDRNGTVVWRTSLPGRVIGAPVTTSEGTIYVGVTLNSQSDQAAGKLVALSAASGQVLWQFATVSPIESTMAVSDIGEVYFGDNGGMVYAVDVRGKCLWTESTGSPVRSAGTIVPIGQVIFGLDDGSLVAMRCDSKNLSAGWPKWLGTTTNRSPMNHPHLL